jgi:hypothetical protein
VSITTCDGSSVRSIHEHTRDRDVHHQDEADSSPTLWLFQPSMVRGYHDSRQNGIARAVTQSAGVAGSPTRSPSEGDARSPLKIGAFMPSASATACACASMGRGRGGILLRGQAFSAAWGTAMERVGHRLVIFGIVNQDGAADRIAIGRPGQDQ